MHTTFTVKRYSPRHGAAARTTHTDDLIFMLSLFGCDPWLPDGPVQRATQLRLAEYLTGHLLVARFVDREQVVCPLIDIRVVIDTEKVLRRSRAAVQKRKPQWMA